MNQYALPGLVISVMMKSRSMKWSGVEAERIGIEIYLK
ncbi:hypothetical protein HDF11_004754 [Tunturiibacter psychrotolerans]